LIECTRKSVFTTTLPTLDSPSIIVTSVLGNFICDAGLTATPQDLIAVTKFELTEHVQTLHSYISERPLSRAVIVPPLPRQVPSWYNVHLPGLLVHLYSELARIGSPQIRLLTPFVAPVEYFESDGVHLNRDAGTQFVQFIIQGVDQVLPVIDCSSQSVPPSLQPSVSQPSFQAIQGNASVPSSSLQPQVSQPSLLTAQNLQSSHANQHFQGSRSDALLHAGSGQHSAVSVPMLPIGSSLDQVGTALNSLTRLHTVLSEDIQARKNQDNLIFAHIKGDLDFEYNRNRENRFTITGYKPTSPAPSDAIERKDFFRKIVSDLVAEACPELPPDVV